LQVRWHLHLPVSDSWRIAAAHVVISSLPSPSMPNADMR